MRCGDSDLGDSLALVRHQLRHQQGKLIGHIEAVGFALREEAILNTLTEDVVKTSEIEGEILNAEKVRSSIARRLGLEAGALTPSDRNVEGIVEVMDATEKYDQPLTKERLFLWHAALFPTGYSGLNRITVAGWRADQHGPMQVISGAMGQERVHDQAPPASRLEDEMTAFLDWFNNQTAMDASRARSPTWPSRVRKAVRRVSIACPPRFAWSVRHTTRSLEAFRIRPLRTKAWTSRPGSIGF